MIVLYDGKPDRHGAAILANDRAASGDHGGRFTHSHPAASTQGWRGPRWVDLSSVRRLGSTGDLERMLYRWLYERAGRGRCPILNISGGAEIGRFLARLPIQRLKASRFRRAGRPLRGQLGCVPKPARSMPASVWNDPERYLEAYSSHWPGVWYHGNWASVDADGHWICNGGRSVVQRSGVQSGLQSGSSGGGGVLDRAG